MAPCYILFQVSVKYFDINVKYLDGFIFRSKRFGHIYSPVNKTGPKHLVFDTEDNSFMATFIVVSKIKSTMVT